jgi:putative intracellular protease/amidase
VFYAGGHGPLWDRYNDSESIALIETFIATGKPVAAVCHASAVLLKAKDQAGQPLVQGKQVTGFSNSEEAAVELTDVVPYLLEDQLVAMGGIYQKVDDWNPLAITDGLLITGQNPASSDAVAEALFKAIS